MGWIAAGELAYLVSTPGNRGFSDLGSFWPGAVPDWRLEVMELSAHSVLCCAYVQLCAHLLCQLQCAALPGRGKARDDYRCAAGGNLFLHLLAAAWKEGPRCFREWAERGKPACLPGHCNAGCTGPL